MNIVLLNWETREVDKNLSTLAAYFEKISKDCRLLITTETDMINIFNSCNLDAPIILIRDSSIIQISKEDFIHKIHEATQICQREKISLLYLSSWGEKCDQLKKIYSFDDNTKLCSTAGNRSTQALLLMPCYAKKLLQKMNKHPNKSFDSHIQDALFKKKLKAAAFVPNIVQFDIEVATTKYMFNRANLCFAPASENQEISIYVWLAICIFLLILAAWAIFSV